MVVATIVMLIISSVSQKQYEEELRHQLATDIDNTVKIIDQRMVRVEYITRTAASLLGSHLDYYTDKELGAAVYGMMKDVECIDVTSLTLFDDKDDTFTTYVTYNQEKGDKRNLVSLPPLHEDLSHDFNWIESYQNDRNVWATHFTPSDDIQDGLQCYSVPVYSPDSVRCGMLCTMILESFITRIVKNYNIHPDICITIYDPNGTCIAKTGDDDLSSDKILTEERTVDRLKWRMVFSASQSIIMDKLKAVMLNMILSIIILLISLVVSIMLTIRYVARPFVLNQKLTVEAKASMERELKIAADTQRQLVPHSFPPFPHRGEIDLHACLHPARQVGGDLYDYFIHDDQLYFCIGDVSGKGAPASLFMAATHYLFRSVASVMPMTDAVQQINRSLCIDNDNCNFVTFFFAKLDLTTGMLEYTNAGHNCPIIINNGEARFFAESESSPLGIWDEEEYPTHSLQLCKDDTILLYTDGVTEAMNPQGVELGNDNTLHCVADSSQMTPEAIIGNVLECVRQHADTAQQSDDITILCVQYKKGD